MKLGLEGDFSWIMLHAVVGTFVLAALAGFVIAFFRFILSF